MRSEVRRSLSLQLELRTRLSLKRVRQCGATWSGVVVVIGYIILIPSVLGILFAVF